jgi:predicted ArsR family transcriptional regulator
LQVSVQDVAQQGPLVPTAVTAGKKVFADGNERYFAPAFLPASIPPLFNISIGETLPNRGSHVAFRKSQLYQYLMTDGANPSDAKRAILDVLKRRGPSEAQDIAGRLGVTSMAVRQHLYTLESEGLVAFAPAPKDGSRGRPSKLWRALPTADALFGDAHAELSVELIGNIREVFGERGLDRLIAKRTDHQVATYQVALASAGTLKEKVRRLARLRTEAGYMAEARTEGDSFLLIENHCPICRAAKACTGLCRQELEVFQAALGPDFVITRTDHILAGARRCAYKIRAK